MSVSDNMAKKWRLGKLEYFFKNVIYLTRHIAKEKLHSVAPRSFYMLG